MASSRCPRSNHQVGWSQKGKKQKKKRRQQEEDVITRSGSKAQLKKYGTMIMTCSICGGTGHNKRYHQRPDAPNEEWLAHNLYHTCSQRSSQIDKGRSRAKLVPRRPNTSLGDEVEPLPPPPSEFQFMPTAGIGLTKDAQVEKFGPLLTMPTPAITSLLTMVEDLQEIENQENAKKGATRAKNFRVVRGSMSFVAPRRGNNAATQ
ncbi:Uncharacterized protein Adt_34084 [Abeliophyllum distichum]|uniref:Uncharacterized protein n=1 Tax=Abeliophyllum distichum TaxID=126358 RepID=A0ABD1R032_9LAMI